MWCLVSSSGWGIPRWPDCFRIRGHQGDLCPYGTIGLLQFFRPSSSSFSGARSTPLQTTPNRFARSMPVNVSLPQTSACASHLVLSCGLFCASSPVKTVKRLRLVFTTNSGPTLIRAAHHWYAGTNIR
ncbi:hypothetical protein B0H12DRAFT_121771 [Mycena haematopus]|nr:hypothetical protein B0H12DRAFT_121771 [Mycena haematopus]